VKVDDLTYHHQMTSLRPTTGSASLVIGVALVMSLAGCKDDGSNPQPQTPDGGSGAPMDASANQPDQKQDVGPGPTDVGGAPYMDGGGGGPEAPVATSCPEKRLAGDYNAVSEDDLSSLRDVTHVDGTLNIWRTNRLVDLTALRCLRAVAYNLTIDDNRALKRLTGLEGLTEVGGSISLARNDLLEDMAALANLTAVAKRALTSGIDITANPKLIAVRLDGLKEVPGSLRIDRNNGLVDLQGLSQITTVGRQFFVRGSASLRTLRGTEALKSVGDRDPGSLGVAVSELEITENPLLPQCEVKALHDRLLANGFQGQTKLDQNQGTCP
jgi:hypothetical protein